MESKERGKVSRWEGGGLISGDSQSLPQPLLPGRHHLPDQLIIPMAVVDGGNGAVYVVE